MHATYQQSRNFVPIQFSIKMASRDNNRDLREGEIQGRENHSDRKGKGGDSKRARTTKVKMGGRGANDNVKECGSRQTRGSNNHDDGGKISKRRRLNKPHPRPRFCIPEARVVQAFNERAHIYDSEHEDDNDNCDFPIEANPTGAVAVPDWLKQKIQQRRLKEEKMKNKARNDGDGKSRHTHKRCHCFDCW